MKKFLTLILTVILMLTAFSGCEGCDNTKYANAEEDAVYTQQDVIKEVANAYLRQATQINYNQTLSRRNIDVSPEEATSQHLVYLDCSSFVNAVYKEAFGVNIIPDSAVNGSTLTITSPQTNRFRIYAEENLENSDVLGIWYSKDYETASEKQAILDQIKNMLQVGDVINYRRKSNTGHAILYLGDGKIIHSIGDDFSPVIKDSAPWETYDGEDKKEHDGSVQLMTVEDAFETPSSDRYLMGSQIENVSLFRPLNRNLTVTEKTHKRMLIKGLNVEKTASKGVNTGLIKGDEITYTLTIENNRDLGYKDVEVKDVLDANLTFVSGSEGVSNNGQNITAKITVKAGETVNVSWTAKVKGEAVSGAVISSSQTTIGGMKLPTIKHSVSGYTQAQLNLVSQKAKEYASQSKRYDNPIGLVKEIYKEALNVNLFDAYDSVYSVLDALLDDENKTVNVQNDVYKMVAPDIYGGFSMQKLYQESNYLVRLITTQNLSVGDVIIAEKDYVEADNTVTQQAVYVYVGGNELVAIDTNQTSFTKNKARLVTMAESRKDYKNVLVSVYAFNRYAVIRPSMIA